MRKAYSLQLRLDGPRIENVCLNLECRDEIVPVLAGLQHVFDQKNLRDEVTRWIGDDINRTTRTDIGREGFDYWQIFVMSVIRLGCNLNYDKLQDLCENHRALRCILGVGDWDETTSFDWRRIRDTIELLQPATIEQLNHVIVAHGQVLHGGAREQVRADSFVMETNIHHPSDSSLIWDGVKKLLPLAGKLAGSLGSEAFRQSSYQRKKIKQQVREIARVASSKSSRVKAGLEKAYEVLLTRVGLLLDRVRALQKQAQNECLTSQQTKWFEQLNHWYELTSKVTDNSFRRTQLLESVPNNEKIFSLFEPHTQLYRKGKAGQPNQFGRQVMVYEDGAGFISHYFLMGREALDSEVVVEQTKIAQHKHGGEIEEASFDRGYFSNNSHAELQLILDQPCLPPRHRNPYCQWLKEQPARILRARDRHSGIESMIGSIQRGNGMKRCRDRSEKGLERYLGSAILGRNLQTLGKLLITSINAKSEAARTKRKKAG